MCSKPTGPTSASRKQSEVHSCRRAAWTNLSPVSPPAHPRFSGPRLLDSSLTAIPFA